MTNATVHDAVHAVDGHTATLKCNDEEQRIVIPPNVAIVTYLPGRRDELAKGAAIFAPSAIRQTHGTLKTQRIMVGRNARLHSSSISDLQTRTGNVPLGFACSGRLRLVSAARRGPHREV
jgi:hypothetical protein